MFSLHKGPWRSLVARSADNRKVEGSNPSGPIPRETLKYCSTLLLIGKVFMEAGWGSQVNPAGLITRRSVVQIDPPLLDSVVWVLKYINFKRGESHIRGNFYPDVHGDEGKYHRVLRNLKKDEAVLESNKKLILRFDSFCRANKVSYSRRWHYVQWLGRLARWLGGIDFREATKDDIIKLVGELEELRNPSLSAPNGITSWP